MQDNFLSGEELKRYTRQIILEEIGYDGQQKLKAAKVLVVGAGGLGCPVLQYLSAAGVGTIGIVDFDTVDISNMHRQTLYTTNDIGKKKTVVAEKRLKELNPENHLAIFDLLLNENNCEDILKDFDIVVDGSDNFLTRYLVNDTCVKLKKPLVYGSILKFEGQLTVFNYRGSKNLRDLFPDSPNPEDVPNCNENGVMGTLPAIIGSMMAHETLKLILGLEVLANRMIIFDSLQMKMQEINY